MAETSAGTRHIIHLSYRNRGQSPSRHYFRLPSATPATADVIKYAAQESHSTHAMDIEADFGYCRLAGSKAGTRHIMYLS